MNLAEITDIEARWRPLRGAQEPINAASWLTDASGMLRNEVDKLDERMSADPGFANLVRGVTAAMVIRVLRGQDRTDGADYSGLYISKSEGDLLDTSPDAAGAHVPVFSFPAYLAWPEPLL